MHWIESLTASESSSRVELQGVLVRVNQLIAEPESNTPAIRALVAKLKAKLSQSSSPSP